jgi:phospholipase/carboxylesterase
LASGIRTAFDCTAECAAATLARDGSFGEAILPANFGNGVTMNRIHGSHLSAAGMAAPHSRTLGAATYTASDQACRHSSFAPLHYEPNYAYPLLVWLHGPGGSEKQLKRVMPLVSLRNYIGVAPRGMAMRSDAAGYGWRQTDDHIFLAEQRVFACVDQVRRRFNIDPTRVFLAGYDCGGTMALRLAMRHPQRFAGVISLSGPFPQGGAPLGRLLDARRLPVLILAGRE